MCGFYTKYRFSKGQTFDNATSMWSLTKSTETDGACSEDGGVFSKRGYWRKQPAVKNPQENDSKNIADLLFSYDHQLYKGTISDGVNTGDLPGTKSWSAPIRNVYIRIYIRIPCCRILR